MPHATRPLGFCGSPEQAAALAGKPFDYFEGNVQQLFMPEAPDADFEPSAARIRACGLPMPAANCFLPASLKVTGPSVDHARLARYAENAFRRAASVGTRVIVFGSGGARQCPDGWPAAEAFEQMVAALGIVGPIAAAHGVTIALEPLHRGECNVINTVLEGAVAVARANHPSVRLLVDIFHMLRNGEPADDILKVGPWLAHAHIAENRDRAQPGVHNEDLRPYLRALDRAGYHGPLSIEADWTRPVPESGAQAAEALRHQLVATT